MIMGPVFEQFVEKSPISVMARATVEHVLEPAALDKLFEENAERGYTKELLFSTTVELMSRVVAGKAPHVQSAYQQMVEEIPVQLTNVYEKLKHIETHVSAELVRHTAGRCEALVREMGGSCAPLLDGYRVKIVDGNHLAATQKRLKLTRGHSAAPLPGQSLVILDPELMLMTDLIPCQDAHAQERALLEEVLALIQPNEVWIEDRNFCTVDFLLGIDRKDAYFVTRQHGNTTIEPEGEFGQEVQSETGWVSERWVWVCRDDRRLLRVRQVRVRLKEPTEDGDVEVMILTNLPEEAAGCVVVANLYLKRWKIEGAFHELTMALECEVNTLGYPKAALFAFCVAVVAYNILSVLKAAMRSVHGEEKVQKEVSGYYMALEWSMVYAGMMIAVPDPLWECFAGMPAKELAALLREWAAKINLKKIKKSPPRKPTKTKTQRIQDDSPHLSTARLLEQSKIDKQAKSKARKPV